MVEAEFLLELLMGLLTDPPGLDRGGELSERGLGRQVRQVVLLLAARPPLADKPDLVARHALHAIVAHPVLVAVCHTDTSSDKPACQAASGAAPPVDRLPSLAGQHGLGRDRRLVGDVVLALLAGLGDGEDQGDIGRINVMAPRQPHRPPQAALAQGLAERSAGAVPGIGEHAAKAGTGGDDTVDLLDGDLRFCQSDLPIFGNARPRHSIGVVRPGLGKEEPQPHHHRHFARRQGHRDQRLAIGRFAERGSVLRRDPDRVLPLFRQRGVVDDEKAPLADVTVRLLQ
jgi:hypothetical protein